MKNFYHIGYHTVDNKVGSFNINAKSQISALDTMYDKIKDVATIDRIYENSNKVYDRI